MAYRVLVFNLGVSMKHSSKLSGFFGVIGGVSIMAAVTYFGPTNFIVGYGAIVAVAGLFTLTFAEEV